MRLLRWRHTFCPSFRNPFTDICHAIVTAFYIDSTSIPIYDWGWDYYDSDFSSFYVDTPDICAQYCDVIAGCYWWTLHTELGEHNQCLLKSARTLRVWVPGAVSGQGKLKLLRRLLFCIIDSIFVKKFGNIWLIIALCTTFFIFLFL